MNEDTAQQINDLYETLPQDIKDVLSSEDTGKKLGSISKNHSLHIDQAAQLSDLTSLVMLGAISPSEFVSEIQSEVHVSSTEATAIANEINENILLDIKASLEKLYKDDNLIENEEKEPEDFSTLNKKDILSEIENPTPAPSAAPVPRIVTPIPPTINVIKTQPVKALVESTGEDLIAPPSAPTLIEQKLTQTVRTPEPQKVELTSKPASKLPPVAPKPLSNVSGVDSYREPIE